MTMYLGTGALALIVLAIAFFTGHLLLGIILAVVILALGGGIGYNGRARL